MMKTDLDKIQKRAIQYWYVDGLTEISFGLVCLILGLYFYIRAVLPEDSNFANLLDMGFVLFVVGGTLLVGRLQSYLKNRITYPRTGYIEYKRKKPAYQWIGRILAALIAVLAAALLASSPAALSWMPAISGFLFAAILLYLGFRTSLLRFYLISLGTLVAGVGLAFTRVENILGLGYFYFLVSILLFISGGITLYTYLKNTTASE